ncbi:MAG: hypothetical protein ACI80S_000081 [Pseudohongiellaceae bacterium]|jgi:hypothetical protein
MIANRRLKRCLYSCSLGQMDVEFRAQNLTDLRVNGRVKIFPRVDADALKYEFFISHNFYFTCM